jgi:hypothetical protein
MDLAPSWIPSWSPAISPMYTGRSLLHTWYPDRQLFGTLNAHILLQLESKGRLLAHRIPWNPERQCSLTGGFLLVVSIKGLYYWSNVS